VVAEDKVLAPVETLQDWLDVGGPEEQIAENVDRVVRLHLGVPLGDHRLVHLVYRGKRPMAQPDDVEMPEMLV